MCMVSAKMKAMPGHVYTQTNSGSENRVIEPLYRSGLPIGYIAGKAETNMKCTKICEMKNTLLSNHRNMLVRVMLGGEVS